MVRLFSLKAQTTAYFRSALLQSIKQFLKSLESETAAHDQLTEGLKAIGLQQWKTLPLEYLEDFVRFFVLPGLTELEKEKIQADIKVLVTGQISRTESARLPTYIKLFDAYHLLSKAHLQEILERFILNDQMAPK